jgi:hypothetical protein
VDKKDIERMMGEVEAEDAIFAGKVHLDSFTFLQKLLAG